MEETHTEKDTQRETHLQGERAVRLANAVVHAGKFAARRERERVEEGERE